MTRPAAVRLGDLKRVIRAYAAAGLRTRTILKPGEIIVEALDSPAVPSAHDGEGEWDARIDRLAH